MKRIGVISDTHIPKSAKSLPHEVFLYFKNVDIIIHAGDLTVLPVLDELRSITPNVTAVLGNMDLPENQSVLPSSAFVDVEGVKIGIIHGWGSPMGLRMRVWNKLKENKPNIVIFGHSHQPEKITADNVLFLNPGSPTDKFFTSVNSIAMLTIEDGKVSAEIKRI